MRGTSSRAGGRAFDFQGGPVGSKVRVGMYPDDLAVTPDGRHALVLTSGRAEGGAHRPAPALDVVALGSKSGSEPPRVVGHVTFEGPGDDPARLTLSATGRRGGGHAAGLEPGRGDRPGRPGASPDHRAIAAAGIRGPRPAGGAGRPDRDARRLGTRGRLDHLAWAARRDRRLPRPHAPPGLGPRLPRPLHAPIAGPAHPPIGGDEPQRHEAHGPGLQPRPWFAGRGEPLGRASTSSR